MNMTAERSTHPAIEAVDGLLTEMGARHVVIYDDTWRGIPEYQRELAADLAAAERGLYHGALVSHRADTTVLCRGFPAPLELAGARAVAGARDLRVLVALEGGAVDITAMTDDELWRAFLTDTEPRSDDVALRALTALGRQLPAATLLLPYQTMPVHHRMFDDRFMLLDAADRVSDKRLASACIRQAGHARCVPEAIAVPPADVNTFTRTVLRAVDTLHERGSDAYVKLATVGTRGLANVVPRQHPIVYDPTVDTAARAATLSRIIADRGLRCDLTGGTVERRIDKQADALGDMELTVGGLLVRGRFMACYVGRNLNTPHDSTRGMVHSDSPAAIGLDHDRRARVVADVTHAFEALSNLGYATGYAYCDVILARDGSNAITDYNMRRGLRSAGEAVLASRSVTLWDSTTSRPVGADGADVRSWAEAEARRGRLWYGSPWFACHGDAHLLYPADGAPTSIASLSGARAGSSTSESCLT